MEVFYQGATLVLSIQNSTITHDADGKVFFCGHTFNSSNQKNTLKYYIFPTEYFQSIK